MKNAKNACFFAYVFTFFGGKTLQKGPKIDQKSAKTLQKLAFLCLFGRCTDFPDSFPTGSRVVPDWFPTGSRFPKSGVGICRKRCQVLARNLPNFNDFVGLGKCFGAFGAGGG